MAKEKGQMDNDLQHITQKHEDRVTRTPLILRRGHVITMASTSLQVIKLECECCRVVFITFDEFLTFMTYRQIGSNE
jgi:hypothetical protein